MIRFIIIPESFAASMNGKQIGPNIFKAVQTLDGRWVTSPNAIGIFTHDFDLLKDSGWKAKVILLKNTDFYLPEEDDEEPETI